MASTISPLGSKLSGFFNLSEEEARIVDELEAAVEVMPPHREILAQGDRSNAGYVILEGWTCCYKLLSNGRRQNINFALSGDLIGVRAFMLRVSDHSLVTIGDCRLGKFSRDRMLEIINDYPRLATAIFWSMARDEAIIVEHLVSMGRRSALEAMAHLMLELQTRLSLVGLNRGESFTCPATQEQLGDLLGISTIHVNRTLRELRERDLMLFQRHEVNLLDIDGLIELAGYDPEFLGR